MMKKFLQIATVSAIAIFSLEASACWLEDVMVTYDSNCNVTNISYQGKDQEKGSDIYNRVMNRVKNNTKDGSGSCKAGTYAGGAGSGAQTQTEELRQAIIEMMYVKTDSKPGESSAGSGSGEKKSYIDNINSVRENQNKIKLNESTRAIALGRRAVSLALESGKDVDERREAIEQNDEVIKMLKEIAKLQAQHLQKINEITALKAKLLAMNSIENIIAGGISTTDKKALEAAGSNADSEADDGSDGGSYNPGIGNGDDL